MIHIGSAEFYRDVRQRIDRCDVVLFEGVRSATAKIISTSYTFAARRKRLGLVTQGDALPVAGLKGRRIHADSTTADFEAAWASIPWRWRLAVTVYAPLYGMWLYLTASRETIGRRLSSEDLEDREDVDMYADLPEFAKAIRTERDARLVGAIEDLLGQPGDQRSAAVIYGAAHMRVVTRLLADKHGYQVAKAEWLHVFQYIV